MYSRIQRIKIVAAAMAASLAAIASPASAVVTQTSEVLISANGFAVGGSASADGAPTAPAELQWDQGWFGVQPRLFGTIHFYEVADSCARVEMTSYDEAGVELSVAHTGEKCAFADGHAERAFELPGAVSASEVRVVLQTLAVNGDWGQIGNAVTVSYGPTLSVDEVVISRKEMDLGDGRFIGGAPEEPATVTWVVSAGDQITPVLQGSIFMHEADNECARIRVKYISSVLGVLDERLGTEHCVLDDDLHIFPAFQNGFADPAVDEVKYILESRLNGGVWETVGIASASL